jgi:small subunit ribosomal protein S1
MSEPHVPLHLWQDFLARHSAGGALEGRVTKVLPFGAFVEVGDGIHGLLPRVAWTAPPSPGSGISVKIDSVDVERRRVSLSLA